MDELPVSISAKLIIMKNVPLNQTALQKNQSLWSFFKSNDIIFFFYIPISILFLVILNLQAITNPDWLPAHDTVNQLTEFLYAISAYQNGELPLWNSYLYGGQPFYLLMNHGLLLNPIMWVWIILGTLLDLRHINIFVYYHLTDIVFFALGGLFFVREITKDKVVSVAAFIILLFSGDADYWLNQIWSFAAVEYIPWILFFGIRYFKKQTVSRCAVFAVFLGVSINVYMPVYTAPFMITLTLLLLIYHFDLITNIDFRKLFKHILIAVPIIAAMALPIYLNYSEITNDNYQIGRSTKGPDQEVGSDDSLNRNATSGITSMGMTSRGDLDRISPGMFAVRRGYSESVPLIGIVAFVFMILGIVTFSRNSLLWFSLLLLMILNYIAWATPYHYLSFYLMPLYKMIRSFGFFSGYIILTAAILACIGLQDLLQKFIGKDININKISFWKKEILFLLIFIVASFLGYKRSPNIDRFFPLILIFVFALSIFLLNKYFKIATVFNLYKHLLIILFFAIGAYNLFIINGSDAPYRNVKAKDAFTYSSKFNFSPVRPNGYVYLPLAKAGAFTECCITFYNIAEKIDGPWFFDGWGSLHTLFVDKKYYYLSKEKWFDRLMKHKLQFFRYYTVPNNPSAKIDLEFYLRKSILPLEDDSEVKFRNAKLAPAIIENTNDIDTLLPSSLSLLKKSANTVSFDIDIREDVFMLYTDLYHKGFTATIDGKEVSILKGFGIFKAIELYKGRHVVEFRFKPFYGYVLFFYLIISIGFFISICIWGIITACKTVKTEYLSYNKLISSNVS